MQPPQPTVHAQPDVRTRCVCCRARRPRWQKRHSGWKSSRPGRRSWSGRSGCVPCFAPLLDGGSRSGLACAACATGGGWVGAGQGTSAWNAAGHPPLLTPRHHSSVNLSAPHGRAARRGARRGGASQAAAAGGGSAGVRASEGAGAWRIHACSIMCSVLHAPGCVRAGRVTGPAAPGQCSRPLSAPRTRAGCKPHAPPPLHAAGGTAGSRAGAKDSGGRTGACSEGGVVCAGLQGVVAASRGEGGGGVCLH